MDTTAWALAHVMTMWAKKGKSISARRLFRRPGGAPEFETAEEMNDYMRKKREELEG